MQQVFIREQDMKHFVNERPLPMKSHGCRRGPLVWTQKHRFLPCALRSRAKCQIKTLKKEKNPTVPHQEHRESLNHKTGVKTEFFIVEAALFDLGKWAGMRKVYSIFFRFVFIRFVTEILVCPWGIPA